MEGGLDRLLGQFIGNTSDAHVSVCGKITEIQCLKLKYYFDTLIFFCGSTWNFSLIENIVL